MAAVMQDYMNGSNVLFTVGGKGLGHSTTHSVTYNTETKERGVKPPVKEKTKNALFSGKGVTKMSISVHARDSATRARRSSASTTSASCGAQDRAWSSPASSARATLRPT